MWKKGSRKTALNQSTGARQDRIQGQRFWSGHFTTVARIDKNPNNRLLTLFAGETIRRGNARAFGRDE